LLDADVALLVARLVALSGLAARQRASSRPVSAIVSAMLWHNLADEQWLDDDVWAASIACTSLECAEVLVSASLSHHMFGSKRRSLAGPGLP
jgi:hypothetical protein